MKIPKHHHVYVAVVGSGEFPWDMLRYDCCFPAQEGSDSYALGSGQFETRVVVVGKWSCQSVNFNVDRWRSFGWALVGGRVYDIFDNPEDARRAGQKFLKEWKAQKTREKGG